MISKQQWRLLFLFLLAFSLLTVPVILILIKLVPPDEANTANTVVVQNKVIAVTPQTQPAPVEAGTVTENSKTVYEQVGNQLVPANSEAVSYAPMQSVFIAGDWVDVDCGRRIVVRCPHRLFDTGTSPRFGETNKVLQSHCRDVSIKLDSFCIL